MGYFGVQLWDFDRRKILYAVPLFWHPESIRFSATDGTLVVACSYRGFLNVLGEPPGKIEVWRRGDYERMVVPDLNTYKMDKMDVGHERIASRPHEKENTYCLAISPDGKRFIAGGGPVFNSISRARSEESLATVWDIATGRQLSVIGERGVPILRFCLSPNGRSLYTCGNKVLCWDLVKSGRPVQNYDASGRRTLCVAISPDGTMLAAGDPTGAVLVWHAASASARCDANT